MPVTRSQPRMYHRRLVLIALAMMLVFLGLGTRLAWLSIAQGEDLRATAELATLRRVILPTVRGTIRDRQGQVLSESVAVYAVAVHYSVFEPSADEPELSEWVRRHARRQAYLEIGRSAWGEMTEHEKVLARRERVPFWIDRRDRVLEQVCRAGGISMPELLRRLGDIRDRVERIKNPDCVEKTIAHRVIDEIDDDTALELRRFMREIRDLHPLPEHCTMQDPLEVVDFRKRRQPWSHAIVELPRDTLPSPLRSSMPIRIELDGVARNVIGHVTQAHAPEVGARPFRLVGEEKDLGGYVEGDTVGASGVEASLETVLRGERGWTVQERHASGEERVDPVPGRDVQLTIDLELQRQVEAILQPAFGLTRVDGRWQAASPLPTGHPLDSCAVVIEVASGEILALARSRVERADGEASACDPATGLYAPGSIVKPLVYVGAATDGTIALDQVIECTGHYLPEVRKSLRCWLYRQDYGWRTHGELAPAEAIGRSCNIYFYTLADLLGRDGLVRWFHRFRADETLDVGLHYQRVFEMEGDEEPRAYELGELPGRIPDEPDRGFVPALGIGQRWVWTPLHAANAYAILGRGGRVAPATIVRRPERAARPTGSAPADLDFDPRAVTIALQGLHNSANEHFGTGNHIYVNNVAEGIFAGLPEAGVHVWGKTGTAETGEEIDRVQLDHAWFVGLFGSASGGQPEYAISVLVEYGGSGGRVAGPIAHQIVRAMMRLGYLPDLTEGAP